MYLKMMGDYSTNIWYLSLLTQTDLSRRVGGSPSLGQTPANFCALTPPPPHPKINHTLATCLMLRKTFNRFVVICLHSMKMVIMPNIYRTHLFTGGKSFFCPSNNFYVQTTLHAKLN